MMQGLEALLAGSLATTRVERGPKLVGIRAWIPPGERRTAEDILKLRLRAPDGHFFPVGRVATLEPVAGQPQINREDLKGMLAVTGRISARDLGTTMRDVQAGRPQPH